MVVTLIGYRGSGKSSVAQPLAKRWGWDWIDADTEIERRAGRSIRELFEQRGEAEFRRREREVMADLLKRSRLVIAAGGGTVLDEQTRLEIKQAGPVVWLRAKVETLAQRIQADRETQSRRPNLTPAGGTTEINELLEQREPLYRDCATCTLETDDQTVEQLVQRIVRAIGDRIERGA